MYVKIESNRDGIAKISLSNPNMNLLSNQVKREIHDVFSQISQASDVRVVIFAAEGSHFCCGADLKEFPERIEKKAARQVWDEGHAMLQAILNTPQPTIACIQGNALGGGAELAAAFDFRIFADQAKIGLPEVTRGVIPGNGGLERWIDIAGAGYAMKLLLTGSVIEAVEAKEMGIATEVVAAEHLYEKAAELAKQIASLPAVAVQTAKRAVHQYLVAKNDFNSIGRELFYQVHETEDVREGVQAFIEKRKPVFKHR
ncbi:enoyl-CoA hydratase/isomerase family protein [Effusibacillus dendaii]|uniref:Enoyl-CoA hydratase n=1 Tax=Effusibacillus dendaii TaxID=2743772 RepID=A0A7I8D6K5_9BACL|nr:enoyl-CoA hydratase/isomerase family protein [Effusibacillus dendaii]BCJ85627.1 enoyl-CoA hydratase [Effusibacillus dendaii]